MEFQTLINYSAAQRRHTASACGLLLSFSLCAGAAKAATDLSLQAPHGRQGTTISAGLHVTSDTPLSGINAEIVFPPGISVTNVALGDALRGSGSFVLEHVTRGQNVRVLAYSASNTFTGAGELLKFTVQLDAALLGIRQLAFASTNPEPTVNGNHAVANADGSRSLQHTVSTQVFLVFSETSDYDNDQLPDSWEVRYGLDPITHNGDTDSDNDGVSDRDEYAAGTDPSVDDSGSGPGPRIFTSGFEEA